MSLPPQPPQPPPIPYATPAHLASVPAASPALPGLSPEQFQQIAEARKNMTKIRRAISVATFDSWTTAIFAALTLLTGLFSITGLLLGIGMGVVAWIEFRGAKKLKQLNPDATRMLALNQIGLGALLLLYSIYSLWGVFHNQSALSAALASQSTEVTNMLGDIPGMERMIGLLVYGILAAVAIFGQGGTAWFYASRRKYIEAYIQKTPTWIIDAQRAGMGI